MKRETGVGAVRVSVDRELCVGHGRCYVLAPEVFDEDERGHCVIRRAHVPAALRKQAELGRESCPESAILLENDAPPAGSARR